MTIEKYDNEGLAALVVTEFGPLNFSRLLDAIQDGTVREHGTDNYIEWENHQNRNEVAQLMKDYFLDYAETVYPDEVDAVPLIRLYEAVLRVVTLQEMYLLAGLIRKGDPALPDEAKLRTRIAQAMS